MKLYLNAGFGEPLGHELLRTIADRGFAGIRQDIPTPNAVRPLINEIAMAGIHAILLVNGGKMDQPPEQVPGLAANVARLVRRLGIENRVAIEVGNEPDASPHYANNPERFAHLVHASHAKIRTESRWVQIITGGVTTTSNEALNYLAATVDFGIPEDCTIGYHSYRTTREPEWAHKGFPSREAEFATLKEIADRRPIANTEIGWHTAPSVIRYGCWGLRKKTVQFSDEQVADFAGREFYLNADAGAESLTWFQLNDGPDASSYEHRFGIRRQDGTWKPVADTLREL
jgi:hypothetical protein